MKKIFVICFILCLALSQCVYASEETEDYIDMASSSVAQGDYVSAKKYVNQALLIEPSNKDLLDLKSTLNRISNPNYVPYLKKAYPFFTQAVNSKKSGNKEAEISILEQNSGNFWGSYLLADLYRKNENYSDAITYYKKALNINSSYSQSYLGLGISEYEIHDYTSAIATFQKYLELNPNSDLAYTMLAKCYLQAGNANLALNNIEKALYISDNLENKLLQGEILYEMGYYAQSKNVLESLKTNIQTSDIYKYIGLCEYKMNNYADALLNIDKAIILSDDAGKLNMIYNEIKQKLDNKNI